MPWAFEVLAVVTSLVLFGALAAILSAFDGKPIFDSHALTLNTVVATLSTAAKANILVAIANCIGQWKWILFAGAPRRLLDFERLDQAARGPLGGLNLIFNTKVANAHLVRIGALITVIAIAIDPFSQQLVQYRPGVQFVSRPGEVTVPRAERYSRGNEIFLSLAGVKVTDGKLEDIQGQQVFPDADFSFQAATVFGISESTDRISQQVNFQCPSSLCQYPTFRSLAVCSRCENIDSRLARNTNSNGAQYVDFARGNQGARAGPNQTEYRLPNGLFLNNLRGNDSNQLVYMTMAGTPYPEKSIVMQDIDTLIWAQSAIKTDIPKDGELWPDYAVHATECALYYCVREYSAKVTNGTLNEASVEIGDERRNPASWQIRFSEESELLESLKKSIAFDPIQSIVGRTDLQLGSTFNLSREAVDSISNFVRPIFGPCLNRSGDCDFNEQPINGYYVAQNGLDEGIQQYDPPAAKVLWESANFQDVFDNVALSMSNAIRNGADEGDSATIVGRVSVNITVYKVDWRWIVLHVAIEVGAVVFLAVTAWVSRTRYGHPLPVWKSSALAALAKGENIREPNASLSTRVDLEDRARGESLALIRHYYGSRVGGYKPMPSNTVIEMDRFRHIK